MLRMPEVDEQGKHTDDRVALLAGMTKRSSRSSIGRRPRTRLAAIASGTTVSATSLAARPTPGL
jgi:hypothetical protein